MDTRNAIQADVFDFDDCQSDEIVFDDSEKGVKAISVYTCDDVVSSDLDYYDSDVYKEIVSDRNIDQ